MMLTPDDAMGMALAEGQEAQRAGDVPVGAVVLHQGQVVSRGRNRREALQDPTWHAELEALREAARHLGAWRLTGCTLVVTLEPCAMCAYAAVLARVEHVVFGARDPRLGAAGSLHQILVDSRHNHRPAVTAGVREEECAQLLKTFFALRRSPEK
jgi:tRNA(adenine34) deaminase